MDSVDNLADKITMVLEAGGTGIVEMLFCTSLVALVGAGEHPAFSPRQLQIINTKVTMRKPLGTLRMTDCHLLL